MSTLINAFLAKDCGAQPVVKNGQLVTSTGTEFGDELTYSCLNGYTPVGSLTVICDENGTWTTPPTCER